jgi:type I restriction enzyme, R subunit
MSVIHLKADIHQRGLQALAENESARHVMGEPTLRVIAHELVTSIKSSISVVWMHREVTRARMRVLVKRLLRKYGYPPDYRCCFLR